MPLSNKNHSPVLTLLTLPVFFPLFLILCRLYLKFFVTNSKSGKKRLLSLSEFFHLEHQELVKLPEFNRISDKARIRFLEQFQKIFQFHINNCLNPIEKRALNKTLNLIEQKQQLAVSYAHPYRMYLEMTRNCNLRCRICCQSIVDIDRPEITPELIRKLSPLIPYCESVAVYGFGESLAAPHFFDYMRQLPFDNNQTVLLTTNGTLLSPDKSRLILDSPINMLGISLDAANPDTYEYIRGKRLWQQIIDNIKYFNQLKQERGQSKPTLRFDFVALRKNIEELPNFVRLAKELHAEHIDVGYMNTYREELREQSLFFYQELSDRIFSEAKQIATQLGIDLHLPPMFHPENQPNPGNNGAPLKHSECREPWQFIQICADGSVIPCWNTSKPLGNLNDDTFETIWNNPAFQEFRQYLNSNKEMYRCRYCLDYRFRNIHNINHHILVLEKS